MKTQVVLIYIAIMIAFVSSASLNATTENFKNYTVSSVTPNALDETTVAASSPDVNEVDNIIPDDIDNEISPEKATPSKFSSPSTTSTSTTSKPANKPISPADSGVDLSSINLFFDLLNLKLNMTRRFLGSVRDNLFNHIEDYFSVFQTKIEEHNKNVSESRKNGTGVVYIEKGLKANRDPLTKNAEENKHISINQNESDDKEEVVKKFRKNYQSFMAANKSSE